MGWLVKCILLVLVFQQVCSTAYQEKKRTKRLSSFGGCPIGYQEKEGTRKKRNSIYSVLFKRCRYKLHAWGWGRKKRDTCSGVDYKAIYGEDNMDVAKKCCFILYSGGTKWILTDHEFQNPDFKETCPGDSCAYSPLVIKTTYKKVFLNSMFSTWGRTRFQMGSKKISNEYFKWVPVTKQTIDTSQEVCLSNNIIGQDKQCCSQESGSLCENYPGYASISRNSNYGCHDTCKEIADCQKDPGNDWCKTSNITEVLTAGKTLTSSDPKIRDECVAQLDDEPVQQTAKFVPKEIANALKDMKQRKKRSIWSACPSFNHWKFTCYEAVHYMLYYQQENWSRKMGENGKWKGWKYFEHDCCSEFQSKCKDKKVFKKHKEFANCPPKAKG